MLERDQMGIVMKLAREEEPTWMYVLVALLANCGLRICEGLHVKKSDIHGDQLEVTRRKKKILRPERIDIGQGLSKILAEWSEMFQPEEYIFPGTCGPCVIHRLDGTEETVCNGGHVSKRSVQRRWQLIVARAGLAMRGRGIHCTRHYAISEFYDKHKDLRAAQLFAGHSSPDMTVKYAQVREMKEKVQAMEATL